MLSKILEQRLNTVNRGLIPQPIYYPRGPHGKKEIALHKSLYPSKP